MPVLVLHTLIGADYFLSCDLYTCREKHNGEVLYILTLMFAISMSLVLLLVSIFIVFPHLIMKYIKPKIQNENEEEIDEFNEE